MKKGVNWFLLSTIFCLAISPKMAKAFWFDDASATAYLMASTFPKTLGNITSPASGSATVRASGNPTNNDQDNVKIYSVSLNTQFSSRGFTLQVKVGSSGWLTPSAAIGKCVWVDANCNSNFGSNINDYPTVPVSIRLLRNSNQPYASIPSGTNIATIQVRQYSRTQPGGYGIVPLYYTLSGSVTPIIPTCDVKSFDANVTLPDVNRVNLVNHGSGRYTAVTKAFKINLACENAPKVSVKFDGDKMPGIASNDVLLNKLSGNENVGVQLVYNSNALKIGENVEVLSAAAGSEVLKLNAYYYYKGGSVQSGLIKASSEFTFTYQ